MFVLYIVVPPCRNISQTSCLQVACSLSRGNVYGETVEAHVLIRMNMVQISEAAGSLDENRVPLSEEAACFCSMRCFLFENACRHQAAMPLSSGHAAHP